ncbi:MAG: efflux RND transporter permease subunit [Spirochaetota bacterium]
MNNVVSYFIKNPLIVNVITVFVLLSGYIMYQNMQKEGYPPVEEPGCSITASCPGATPADVELNVVMKIEEKLDTVTGIKNYSSQSYENFCNITVMFDDGADYEQVRNDIRRELDTIPDFPEEMTDRPRIHEWGSKYMDLMQIGIYAKTADYAELKKRYDELKDRIEDSPYISEIEAWGDRDREIQIKVDLDRLNEYYITFDEIIEAIEANNIQVSGGSVQTGGTEKSIVTLSRFDDPEDVGNVIIRSNLEGNMIRLRDVARVEDTFSDMDAVIRFNGHKGFAMAVYKKENADIITSVDAVRGIIDEFTEEIGTDRIGISVLVDNSIQTKKRLAIVQNNALTGLILVAVMLFIFLNFKNALWAVLGIPFSVCFGIIFMSASGITANSVTLLAMIIVLGMIVDDAIVISENIHRHRILDGTGPETAAAATVEVGFAVMTTILTTLVAFIPLYFMEGVIGSYIKEVPIVISLLLIGSLVESLFILPSHISHHLTVFQRTALGAAIGGIMSYFAATYLKYSTWIVVGVTVSGAVLFALLFLFFYREQKRITERPYVIAMRRVYASLLERILRFRYAAVGFLVLVAALGVYLASTMKFEMFPAVEANRLEITGDIIGNRSLEYTANRMRQIEEFIRTSYTVDTVESYMSINGTSSNPEHVRLILFLTPESTRQIKTDNIIDTLRGKFPKDEFENMNFGTSDGGPHLGNNVEIEISGNNDDYRNEIAAMIMKDLTEMDGANEVNRNDNDTKSQIQIIPEYEEIAKNGVDPAYLARMTRIAFEGYIVTYLKTPEEEVPFRLLLDAPYRNDMETLDRLMVRTSTKNLESISSMIDVRDDSAVTRIKRYNGRRTATVRADFDSNKIKANEIYTTLEEKYREIPRKYPGIRINLGGAAEISNEALGSLQNTMIVAVAAIFVLLVFLFRSLSQPFIVIVAIPFGLLGVVFAFYLHGMPLSFMGIMGAIGLSGVVVNDSLIMVDYINQLRREPDRHDWTLKRIVIEGAQTRLRPIILTTVTTFVGLLPTAYGMGGRDAFILPTAISLSWGLFFSTVLVLLLLPSFYLIAEDITSLLKRMVPGRDSTHPQAGMLRP